MKQEKGITLIALVIMIIVLLILVGISIGALTGNNGILNKAENASEETRQQTATEILKLKITNIQMQTYVKEQRMSNLKELAIALDPENDKDIQSVTKTSQKIASLDWIDDNDYDSIFTILKDYPEYEFEINSSFQLASVNNIPMDSTEIKEEVPEGYLKPEGTKTITANGNDIDVKEYEKVNVNVPVYEVLETGSCFIPNTNTHSASEISISLKNNYTANQQAHLLITSMTDSSIANGAWYVNALTPNDIIIGNVISTYFVNYAVYPQAGTVNYAIIGIANPIS